MAVLRYEIWASRHETLAWVKLPDRYQRRADAYSARDYHARTDDWFEVAVREVRSDEPNPRVEEFLTRLTALSRELGVVITGSGFDGSPCVREVGAVEEGAYECSAEDDYECLRYVVGGEIVRP